MSTFPWVCPYCQHAATIGNENHAILTNAYNNGNKHGVLACRTTFIACPNPSCKEFTLKLELGNQHPGTGNAYLIGEPIATWQLRPNSSAKPLPDYIPKAIVDDYNEACLIRDLSPKASATLSRRCLQGMIRDFWKVNKNRLVDDIKAIEDRVDSSTWESIDAVRSIGNIGAHMEKDINVIVDVEPEEAQLLIGLIEMLIDDWYIARHDRQARKQAIVALAAEKSAARKGDAA